MQSSVAPFSARIYTITLTFTHSPDRPYLAIIAASTPLDGETQFHTTRSVITLHARGQHPKSPSATGLCKIHRRSPPGSHSLPLERTVLTPHLIVPLQASPPRSHLFAPTPVSTGTVPPLTRDSTSCDNPSHKRVSGAVYREVNGVVQFRICVPTVPTLSVRVFHKNRVKVLYSATSRCSGRMTRLVEVTVKQLID